MAELSCDMNGSYFISDFIKSNNIDLKKRKKIIRRLLPKIGDLSTNPNGRHVVENAFNLADIQFAKESLMLLKVQDHQQAKQHLKRKQR